MGFRRKKNIPVSPQLALNSVWTRLSQSPTEKSDVPHRTFLKNIRLFNDDERRGILNDLLAVERDSQTKIDRLRYIRKKIMDLVDRKMSAKYRHCVNESQITSCVVERDIDLTDKGESLDLVLADCEVQIAVLRSYALEKYGDGGKNDWFETYLSLSDYYHDQMMGKPSDGGNPEFRFEGECLAANLENFQKCREKCLNAYVGYEFDIPTAAMNPFMKFFHAIRRKPLWKNLYQ